MMLDRIKNDLCKQFIAKQGIIFNIAKFLLALFIYLRKVLAELLQV